MCEEANRLGPWVLDALQVPGDNKVALCHGTAPGRWVLIRPAVAGCTYGHQPHHERDIFPTTGCAD